MTTFRAALIAGSLSWSVATAAQVQVPNTFTAGTPARAAEVNGNFAFLADNLPSLFFTRQCMTPNCQVTKVNTADDDRQVVATLALPAGQYLVTARVNAYLSSAGFVAGLTSIRVQCSLRDAADAAVADFGTCAPMGNVAWSDATQTMQFPVTFSAPAGGAMQVECRADIAPTAITAGVTAWVWGVSIAATRVASTTIR